MREKIAKNHPRGGGTLRLIAWEVTRSCNLACAHCRASAGRGPFFGELSHQESLSLLEEIASFSSPIVILTGGEPLLRKDIFEIARRGTELGLVMVIGTNGTLLDLEAAKRLISAGVRRASISIDGKDAASHDGLRNVPGAFSGALYGVKNARESGLSFQINTTVTKRNLAELPEIEWLVRDVRADAHHLFLLVPTGRGGEMASDSLDETQYEELLDHIVTYEKTAPYHVKVTCAPQYMRVRMQKSKREGEKSAPGPEGFSATSRGCLGGISFLFIAHDGTAQPCGYLEVKAGDVREKPLEDIWENSPVFLRLRDYGALVGKCGQCEFVAVCGGCRARALAHEGDYMGSEPLCPYIPVKMRR